MINNLLYHMLLYRIFNKNKNLDKKDGLWLREKKGEKNSPNTSLLTTMLQLYIGVTMRCGCFWNALRHPSFTAEMI